MAAPGGVPVRHGHRTAISPYQSGLKRGEVARGKGIPSPHGVTEARGGKGVNEGKLGSERDLPPRAHAPAEGGHGLGVRPNPGRDRGTHGATGRNISAQVNIRALKIDVMLSPRHGNATIMLKVELPTGRAGQGSAQSDQGRGLAPVPVDNHTPRKEHTGDEGTKANKAASDIHVTTNHATEAGVVSVGEVGGSGVAAAKPTRSKTTGRRIGVRNIAGRKHGGRGRGIPEESL